MVFGGIASDDAALLSDDGARPMIKKTRGKYGVNTLDRYISSPLPENEMFHLT